MRKIYTGVIVLLAASLGLHAQNFNPSVEVTNEFLTNTQTADRLCMPMSVPDSVTRFQLQFDYNVFANPYAGSYSFVPYVVNLIPEAAQYDGSSFFLRAGAGYTLHPELTAAYSKKLGKKTYFNVFQTLKGYCGPYHNTLEGGYYNGYDLSETFGVSVFMDFASVSIVPTVSYNGIAVQDLWQEGLFHNLHADLRVSGKPGASKYTDYDMDFLYDYSVQGAIQENRWVLGGSLAPYFDRAERFETDFEIGYTGHSGEYSAVLYNIVTKPHFRFSRKRTVLVAGLRADFIDRLFVFPDLSFRTSIFKNTLGLYASLTGGTSIHSFASLKQQDHHFAPLYASQSLLGSYSVERYNARVGTSCCIGSIVSADAFVGYASNKDALLYNVQRFLVPVDYNYSYAGLEVKLDTRSFKLSAAARYTDAELGETLCYAPASFTSNSSVRYVWRSRLGLGLDLKTSSGMKAPQTEGVHSIAPYQDLGMDAEYDFPSGFSVWGRVGNILDQRVEVTPFIAERGINFTAGICLKLR